MAGIFITFEGIECCGKSTQALLLTEYLKKKGYPVIHTREPGGTIIGESIRKILLDTQNSAMNNLTENLLYIASRVQHIHEVIQPALLSNKIVICDRFIDATLAYQGYARGIDIPLIHRLHELVIENISPDITILLDILSEQGYLRAINKRLDRIEQENIEFHNKVRYGYLQIAQLEPDRVKIIDGSKGIDDVHQMVCNCVDKTLLTAGVSK
ncbi:MAG: dTMP kinase [Candidatus Desantisbacteria bacterium]